MSPYSYDQQVRILIADDDPDDIDFLLESLQNHEPSAGFATVGNGAQLLDFMTAQGEYSGRSELPDLLIVDVNMPVMDGLTAIRRLQKLERFSEIPIVILTTSSDQVLHRQCLEAGARNVYVKPAHIDQMKDIAADIMKICGELYLRDKPLTVKRD